MVERYACSSSRECKVLGERNLKERKWRKPGSFIWEFGFMDGHLVGDTNARRKDSLPQVLGESLLINMEL